jgi:predicted MFS family arabinose efflux permease
MAAVAQQRVADDSARTDWRTIVLMALGFGLVGIDRFMISTLFPLIAKDLHLGYGDIGLITGALAFAWGFAALLMGNRADRLGRRVVIVGALLLFSLLIGASGLAEGLFTLILVRLVMGFADGAYTPASIAATLEAAAPRHHGLAIGFQQMLLPVFGLGIAPLFVGLLLHIVDWRWTFVMFSAPGLLLTWLVWRYLPARVDEAPVTSDSLADWRAVLAFRNIRIAMALMLCWLTCLITTSALMPSYLLDHLHLEFGAMSGVMSAIGLGSAVGTLLLAAVSDRIGRKPVVILAAAGAALSLTFVYAAGTDTLALFGALFAVHFFNNAGITLTVGPLCTEAVPRALMATASGVVIATGEIVGGGLAPVIAGHVAAAFGIANLLWLPIGALCLAIVLALRLIETRQSAVNPN